MRLVDVDIIEKQFDPNTWQGEMMIAIAKGLPTVDLENIISELKSEAERWRDSAIDFDDQKEYGHAQGIEDAIRIIKASINSL